MSSTVIDDIQITNVAELNIAISSVCNVTSILKENSVTGSVSVALTSINNRYCKRIIS